MYKLDLAGCTFAVQLAPKSKPNDSQNLNFLPVVTLHGTQCPQAGRSRPPEDWTAGRGEQEEEA